MFKTESELLHPNAQWQTQITPINGFQLGQLSPALLNFALKWMLLSLYIQLIPR